MDRIDDDLEVDEILGDALSTIDEHLATGRRLPPEPAADLSLDQRRLFETAKDGLEWMERVWPRSKGSAQPQQTEEQELSVDLWSGTGRFGKFEILSELGRGGGGIVFLAVDTSTKQKVALKVPKLEALVDDELRRRFLAEARITIGLDHPGLVPVLEAGEFGSLCYIAAAYAGDTTLASWLEKTKSPPSFAACASLVASISHAVHYLHEHHILHRDIKPSNILLVNATVSPAGDVSELTFIGTPRLTDFGLATLNQPDLLDAGNASIGGSAMLGTPEYMAPEQVGTRTEPLGPSCDVYSLGVVLYETMTGVLPFEGRNRFQTLQRVVGEDPPAPSTRRPGVPRVLEAICLKCLEKTPSNRYSTAAQLADDLERFLSGRPTIARPASPWKKLRTWSRNHRRAVRNVGLVAMIAAVLAVVGGIQHQRLQTQRAEEAHRLRVAWETRHRAIRMLEQGDMAAGLLWLSRALVSAPSAAEDLTDLLRYDSGAWVERTPRIVKEIKVPSGVRTMNFIDGGQKIIACCNDMAVRVLDSRTGQLLTPPVQHRHLPLKARLIGDEIQTVCADGYYRRWSAKTGDVLYEGLDSLNPDLTSSLNKRVGNLLWKFELGRDPKRDVSNDAVLWKLYLDSAKRVVLTVGLLGGARIWDATNLDATVSEIPFDGIAIDAAISSDGSQVAVLGQDRMVHFWGPTPKEELGSPIELPSESKTLAFSPDGDSIAVGEFDGVSLWDVRTRNLIFRLSGQSPVRAVAFSPDGKLFAVGCGENKLRIWKLPANRTHRLIHPIKIASKENFKGNPSVPKKRFDGITSLAFHPNGRGFLSCGVDRGVRFWNLDDRLPSKDAFALHGEVVSKIALSTDGQTLVTGGYDKLMRVWRTDDAKSWQYSEQFQSSIGGLAISSMHSIAVGQLCDEEHVVEVFADRGKRRLSSLGPFLSVFDLQFSPKGDRLAVATVTDAFICDVPSSNQLRLAHQAPVFSISWRPDETTIVTGNKDGCLNWWNPSSGERIWTAPAHVGELKQARYSSDGDLVVSVGLDRKMCFWHDRTHERVGPKLPLASGGLSVAFHPSKSLVVAGCSDGSILVSSAPRRFSADSQRISNWIESLMGAKLSDGDAIQCLDDLEHEMADSGRVENDEWPPEWLFQ